MPDAQPGMREEIEFSIFIPKGGPIPDVDARFEKTPRPLRI
jgi:hypothetical protein